MKPVHWIFVGFLLPIALIVAWGMLDTACTPEAGETARQCYRSWISALSGWAAAIAGGATILVLLYQTKTHQRSANRASEEAKKIFDREVRKLFNRVNVLWKNTEDFCSAENDDETEIFSDTKVMAGYLEATHKEFKKESLENYLEQMLPEDAAESRRLLREIETFFQPLTVTTYNNEAKEFIHVTVPDDTAPATLLAKFSRFSVVIDRIAPRYSQIFNKRDKGNAADLVSNPDDKFEELIETSFQNNTQNPY